MGYARIVVDVRTRSFAHGFDYLVPEELRDVVQVGCTVLVMFSRRPVVGYVVALMERLPKGIAPNKVQPVLQVLAPSAFDDSAARIASWMAQEYACPPCEALRPFLAPGQAVRVRRDEQGVWELVNQRAGEVDVRWVRLSEQQLVSEATGPAGLDAGMESPDTTNATLPRGTGAEGEHGQDEQSAARQGEARQAEAPCQSAPYTPPARAQRQHAVLAALAAGPLRLAELEAMVPNARQAVAALERHGAVCVEERRMIRGVEATTLSSAQAPRPERLTRGQQAALAAIEVATARRAGDVVLVDGVTGSGKTEVYLSAIEQACEQGRGALVLVPEISLTAQTVGRFRARFGDDVAVLHSRLSTGERYDQWDLVRQGRAHVVIGARSALFAPLADVGLIIIDEEHEGSYKQGSAPHYHARELACRLARERGATVVLGSATPSVESLARCSEGSWGGVSWTRVRMDERPGGAMLPEVRIVDMTQLPAGSGQVISPQLEKELRAVVERREKAVLLLNRRGFANFLMCRSCGCVPECPHCSTSLTYHERTHLLACHSCGRQWPLSSLPAAGSACPRCGSRYMGAYGVGTQRVEDELRLLLGDAAEIIRMDADTTAKKGAHQRLLERFDAAECAVLVGTQMIAKGLDFPEVTLVGVVNADTTLKMPDFRAAERTYGLLEQVAGRAGRGVRRGMVLVQTYWAAHPALVAVARHDRGIFLEQELADREDAGYPPYTRLSRVALSSSDERLVRLASDELAAMIRQGMPSGTGWELLGPSTCVKERIKDRVRWQLLLKCPRDARPGPLLMQATRELGTRPGLSVAIDVDCQDLM